MFMENVDGILRCLNDEMKDDECFTVKEKIFMILYILQGLFIKENHCGRSYLSPLAENQMKLEFKISNP